MFEHPTEYGSLGMCMVDFRDWSMYIVPVHRASFVQGEPASQSY